MKLQGIILDFDGTILESADIKDQGWETLYAQYGTRVVAKIMEYHVAHPHVNRYEKFRAIAEQILGEHYTLEEEKKLDKTYTALVFTKIVACPFVAGVENFLTFFSKKVLLCIVTVNPKKYFEKIIVARKIRRYFNDIYTSPWTKQEAMEAILKKHHGGSGSWVSIGDTEDDYTVAKRVGIEFIGRDSGGRFKTRGLFPIYTDMTGVQNFLRSTYTIV